MYDTKKVYRYGSTDEALAIYVINKNRSAKLLEALIGVAAPENVDKLYKKYKSVLFPEEKYDELSYLRKARDTMKKLRGVTINVSPVTQKRRK